MSIDGIRLVNDTDIGCADKKTKRCRYNFLTKALEADPRGLPDNDLRTVRFEHVDHGAMRDVYAYEGTSSNSSRAFTKV